MSGMEFDFLYFLQALHTPFMDQAMKAVTALGEHGLFWLLVGAVLLIPRQTRLLGFGVLLSIAAGFLLGNVALKNLIARQRPCWIDDSVVLLVKVPRDYSFPSGHTLVSFEAAVSIFLVNKKWGAAALAVAAAIGFSRLYLFVHFPSDVLAGALLGTVIAVAVHRGLKYFVQKRQIKQ